MNDVKTITIEHLTTLHQRGHPIDLIDVRTPAEFAEVHASGATSMPLDRLDVERLRALRAHPDQPLYVICRSGSRATSACRTLATLGLDDAVCVTGGTEAWVAAGLPVIRSPRRSISLERQVRIAAGALVLVGVTLSLLIHPLLIAIAAIVGAGLIFAGITDWCGMALLLARMPWNRRDETPMIAPAPSTTA